MLLAHIDQGQGPVLVLLHGFCQDKLLWEDMGTILEKEFRTIRIDLPGHGDSPCFPEKTQPSLDDYADSVIETLDSLSVERFILIGYSMGGYVATSLCQKIPNRLMGVCLIHSTFLGETKDRKDSFDQVPYFLRMSGVAAIVQNTYATFLGYKGTGLNTDPMALTEHLSPEQRDTLKAMIERCVNMSPLGVLQGAMAMKSRPNRRELIPELPFPICFIAGKQDKVLSSSDSILQIGLTTDGQLRMLDNVGHMAPLEAFQKTLLSVLSFSRYCQALEEGIYQ